MDFLKTVTGRVITGLLALGVIAGGISWWQMDPATRHTLATGTGHLLLWLGVLLAAPWATFGITTRVARLDSNMAGGLLVAGYTLVDVILLLTWVLHWHVQGTSAWALLVLGLLVACVYNLLTCDWIAEKLQ